MLKKNKESLAVAEISTQWNLDAGGGGGGEGVNR